MQLFHHCSQRGELVDSPIDAKEEEKLRQEGYCPKSEFDRLITEQQEALRGKKDPFDDYFDRQGFKSICPVCGLHVIDGKCPRC
jgi:rubrerythrin